MTVWPVQVVGVDAAKASQALMHVWGASAVASTVMDRQARGSHLSLNFNLKFSADNSTQQARVLG